MFLKREKIDNLPVAPEGYFTISSQALLLGASLCLRSASGRKVALVEGYTLSVIGSTLGCDFSLLKRYGVDVLAVKKKVTSKLGDILSFMVFLSRSYAAYRFLQASDGAKLLTAVSQVLMLKYFWLTSVTSHEQEIWIRF